MNSRHLDSDVTQNELLELTAEIVSAYVGNNSIEASTLGALIQDVHRSLKTRSRSAGPGESAKPAVPVSKSVTQSHLVCLGCGRELKTLKRHLGTEHGLSPEEYRAKWGLPLDYPMVASQYSKVRSEFAKQFGLGRRSGRRS